LDALVKKTKKEGVLMKEDVRMEAANMGTDFEK